MKRTVLLFLCIALCLTVVACGESKTAEEDLSGEETTVLEQNKTPEKTPLAFFTVKLQPDYDPQSVESMLSCIGTVAEDAVAVLEADRDVLIGAMGDSYLTMLENEEYAQQFCTGALRQMTVLSEAYRTVEADYFKLVAAQGLDNSESWEAALDAFDQAWRKGREVYRDALIDCCQRILDEIDIYRFDMELEIELSDRIRMDELAKQYEGVWEELVLTPEKDAFAQLNADMWFIREGFRAQNTDVDAIMAGSDVEAYRQALDEMWENTHQEMEETLEQWEETQREFEQWQEEWLEENLENFVPPTVPSMPPIDFNGMM